MQEKPIDGSNTAEGAGQQTDSPYAAARLAVALALMTIGACGMYIVPVVLPAVQLEFGVARADASMPYSLLMIGFGVGGLLMGRLADNDSQEESFMSKVGLALRMVSIAVIGLSAGTAASQDYPAKPIRIVTSPAGGGNDFPARLIARGISGPLGQQIIVDNRPTILLPEIVSKAPPDGYTLLVTGSAHWIGPLLDKTNYDAIRDFAPITLVDRAPSVLVVHPSMPVKSVKQLIALAKTRPGELNFSVGGAGSSNYLGAIMFNHMAGVNVVRIPYKGTGPAMAAVMGGEVHAMFASAGGAAPHVKSGRLRALAVGSTAPSALAPGVPTVASAGLPGFISEALHAMFAPAKTPPAILARLNQEVGRYLQSGEAKEVFLKAGIEAAPGSPDQLTAIMRSEIARTEKVLKAAGIGPQ